MFTGKVSTIFCEGGATQIRLTDATGSLVNTGTGGDYLTLDDTLPNYAAMFSLVMASGAQKVPIRIEMNATNTKINSVSFDFPT